MGSAFKFNLASDTMLLTIMWEYLPFSKSLFCLFLLFLLISLDLFLPDFIFSVYCPLSFFSSLFPPFFPFFAFLYWFSFIYYWFIIYLLLFSIYYWFSFISLCWFERRTFYFCSTDYIYIFLTCILILITLTSSRIRQGS